MSVEALPSIAPSQSPSPDAPEAPEFAYDDATVAPEPPPAATPVPPTNDAPIPESSPQDSPDTMRPNATACDLDQSFPLPILTPDRPQPALEPRQLAAIALLTAGKTTAAVASMLKIHRSTLHRWKLDPVFAAELAARRDELRETIESRLYRILLHATHSCIASLKVKDVGQSHRNAFRLMSTMRPWMPRMDTLIDHPRNQPTPEKTEARR